MNFAATKKERPSVWYYRAVKHHQQFFFPTSILPPPFSGLFQVVTGSTGLSRWTRFVRGSGGSTPEVILPRSSRVAWLELAQENEVALCCCRR